MSDTNNKTESKAETAETAPYMKKDRQQDNQTESAKSNVITPLVLLLVSAVVIVATFYESEYKGLVVHADSLTDSLENSSSTVVTATEETISREPTSNVLVSKEPMSEALASVEPPSVDPASKQQTASTTDEQANDAVVTIQAAEVNITPVTSADEQLPDTSTTITAVETNETTTEGSTTAEPGSDQMPMQNRPTPSQHDSDANKQVYEQARKEAIARSLEQRRKQNELMQQRRQAYEQEIQARREQVETIETTSAEDSTAEPTSNQMPLQDRPTPSQRNPYANKQAYEQARKEARARSLEQRRKQNEVMQQRRQAYEQEIQAKREEYEATKKAYQEKRAEIAEAQKEIHQQIEKNRIETVQKMKQMHKEISDMQKQMHQMMRDSQPPLRNNSITPKQDSKN